MEHLALQAVAAVAPADDRSMRQRQQIWVAACRARAHQLGQAVLLRAHVSWPRAAAADPWAAWPDDHSTGFLWHDGRRQQTVAAWGHLADADFELSAAPSPLQAAAQVVQRLQGQAVDLPWCGGSVDPEAPLALVGSQFAAAPPAHAKAPTSPWQRWPAGAVWVPKNLCVARRQRGRWHFGAVVAAWIGGPAAAGSPLGPEDAAADARLVDAIGAQLASMQAAADRPVAQQASVQAAGDRPNAPQTIVAAAPLPAAPRPQELFVRQVQAAVAAMRLPHAELDKVVLATSTQLRPAQPGARFCPRASAQALRARHPKAITYLWQRGPNDAFVGATPETLVQVRGHQVRTHALAGTAARDACPQADAALAEALLASDKDRHEHELVVRMLRQRLAPFCRALQADNTPQVLALRGILHLQTPLRGQLHRAGGLLQLAASLHPTPAVCGHPQAVAAAYLAAEAPLARGWWSGPLGWVTGAGDGIFAVALRSALLQGPVAHAFAGAGIVKASLPAQEWQEVQLKLQAVATGLRCRPA